MNRIKTLRFDSEQRRSIADLCVAAAQLSAGSIVIPLSLLGLDPSRTSMIIFGSILTALLCFISILVVRRKKNKK